MTDNTVDISSLAVGTTVNLKYIQKWKKQVFIGRVIETRHRNINKHQEVRIKWGGAFKSYKPKWLAIGKNIKIIKIISDENVAPGTGTFKKEKKERKKGILATVVANNFKHPWTLGSEGNKTRSNNRCAGEKAIKMWDFEFEFDNSGEFYDTAYFISIEFFS